MPSQSAQVASLHIHPPVAGEPFLSSPELNLIAEKGILEDKRYFGRTNREGRSFKRQVTLVERETLKSHSSALGIADFDPGDVRSNIETVGIDLVSLLGSDVQIGDAILRFVEPRTPCQKMEALAPGLRALMENRRQGVIAMVLKDGRIRPGDPIRPITLPEIATQRAPS